MIGASAGVLLLFSGDILGASGLVSSSILEPEKSLYEPSVSWKLLFLSTFMATSHLLGEKYANDSRSGNDSSLAVVSTTGYLVGGFLVGLGTKLGNGCTTGHGICGMARVSKRSILSVVTFMGSAVITANITAPDNKFFAKSTAFLRTDTAPVLNNRSFGVAASASFVLASGYSLYNLYKAVKATMKAQNPPKTEGSAEETSGDMFEVGKKSGKPSKKDVALLEDSVGKLLPSMVASAMFSFGLATSGMVLPSKILGFLNLHLVKKGTWDPTLAMVMAGGSIVSFLSYQFVQGHGVFNNRYAMECPRRSSNFSIPTNQNIDWQLIGGALAFGTGWGIGGLCPGPALFLAATGTEPIVKFWWPTFLAGSYLGKKIKENY